MTTLKIIGVKKKKKEPHEHRINQYLRACTQRSRVERNETGDAACRNSGEEGWGGA
jgi:hypothetical protein